MSRKRHHFEYLQQKITKIQFSFFLSANSICSTVHVGCRSVFFHPSQLRESPRHSCCACLNDSWGQTADHAKVLRQSSSCVFLCDSCGHSRCCTSLSCLNGSWKESSYERMAVGMELLLCCETYVDRAAAAET
jgi:hypothetical protein